MENIIINGQETDILSYRDKQGKPLSMGAIGMYLVLYNWNKINSNKITLQTVSEQIKYTSRKTSKLINELIDAKYITRARLRDKTKFTEIKYIIHNKSLKTI